MSDKLLFSAEKIIGVQVFELRYCAHRLLVTGECQGIGNGVRTAALVRLDYRETFIIIDVINHQVRLVKNYLLVFLLRIDVRRRIVAHVILAEVGLPIAVYGCGNNSQLDVGQHVMADILDKFVVRIYLLQIYCCPVKLFGGCLC